MKWSFAAIGMFILGLIGVAAIILFQRLTTSNENDYYLLKEITEAAMYDSIDMKEYKETGDINIVREKFVENFTRRYAESTLFIGHNYIISFYDIIEVPPKVTILINTGFQDYVVFGEDTKADYNVQNTLTGIFEFVSEKTQTVPAGSEEYAYEEIEEDKTYYSISSKDVGWGVKEPLNIPTNLEARNIKDLELEIKNVSVVSKAIGEDKAIGEILMAKLLREIDWPRAADINRTDYSQAIDLDTYADNINFTTTPTVYDCRQAPNGICDGNYNTFWINWQGNVDSRYDNIVLKINATWKYKEYKYMTSS